MNFLATDCESILSEIKHQEKQLKLKRRWLTGLTTSNSGKQSSKEPKFLKKHRSLPESLLREDDIFYENIKACVEESFGACNTGKEHNFTQEDTQLFDKHNIQRILISCLDALTNKGLYHIAEVLTGDSAKFQKTRQQMKKVIKESLLNFYRNQNHLCQDIILNQLAPLLYDPKNFLENRVTFLTPTLQSHHANIIKVLDGLEDLPFEALISMCRKLRNVRHMPQLRRLRHGRCRGKLIESIRKVSKRMLSEVSKGHKLPESLLKAMTVAGLSLKLKPGCQNYSQMEFCQFSAEVKDLQNEIVKVIWLLKTNKVRYPQLKAFQQILDPNADISNRCLRTAIKKILIEYLFDCCDMDSVPKSLLEALALINHGSQSTQGCLPKEEMEQAVECVLSVSAQTRQIIWDFLPDHELDQDFADVYMEELEESDDGDYNDSNDGDAANDDWRPESGTPRFSFVESGQELEGIGESMPVNSKSPASAAWENRSSAYFTPNERINGNSIKKIEPEDYTSVDDYSLRTTSSLHFLRSRFLHRRINMNARQDQAEFTGKVFSSKSKDYLSSNVVPEDTKFIHSNQSLTANQYLAIQEICDETSMVAYNLIGHMLEKFAHEDEVDLEVNGCSYLRGNSQSQEHNQGEKHSSSKDLNGSLIVPAVEKSLPSFSKSGMEKLKKLMSV